MSLRFCHTKQTKRTMIKLQSVRTRQLKNPTNQVSKRYNYGQHHHIKLVILSEILQLVFHLLNYMIAILYMSNLEDIKKTLEQYGQLHLLEHLETLTDPKVRENFIGQIKNIDFAQTAQLYQHVYKERNKHEEPNKFQPVKEVASHELLQTQAKVFEQIGLDAIGRGEVGVCIMSGGQGTRLGFDHPKGMFELGLRSGLSLFGFFAHRLQRLNQIVRERTGNKQSWIKWYMMTSEMNNQEVKDYFQKHKFFEYDPQSIIFFPQGGIPALFYDGRVIVESPGNISLAPGGNGAIYGQMKNKGILKHMAEHGVKYIYLGPVDNVLLKLADPVSVGYMIKQNLDIVSHYLRKRSADQKVGLHLLANGRTKILQYSQTDKYVKQSQDQKGNFLFNHGARATMLVTRQFIQRLTNDPDIMLSINKKYHLAQKKVKHYDQKQGKTIAPEKNNGVKFQLFYFDVFEATDKIGVFQTIRQQQFAPLKNATGQDSPQTARNYLRSLHRKWLQRQGITIQGEGDIQIHPGRSYNGEGLRQYVIQTFGQPKVQLPIYIE